MVSLKLVNLNMERRTWSSRGAVAFNIAIGHNGYTMGISLCLTNSSWSAVSLSGGTRNNEVYMYDVDFHTKEGFNISCRDNSELTWTPKTGT